MALNDDVYSAKLGRRALLTMYEKQLRSDLDKILRQHKISLRNIVSSSDRLTAAMRLQVQAQIRSAYRSVYQMATSELTKLYGQEVAYNTRLINKSFGKIYEARRVTRNVTVGDLILRDDRTIAENLALISTREQRQALKIIRQGLIEGIDNTKIARNVANSVDLGRAQVGTLTRTAVTDITNAASDEVYKANDDVIKGFQYVATLDTRTTLICARLDGMVFDVDDEKAPKPPQHYNCRSTTIPIFKSADDIYEDPSRRIKIRELDNISDRTRASFNGQVPARTTYNDWLKDQPNSVKLQLLGDQEKVNLFNKGDLTLFNFQDSIGRQASLETLEKLSDEIAPTRAIFGDTAKFELEPLEISFGTESTPATDAISKIGPIGGTSLRDVPRKGAFYRPSEDLINMGRHDIKRTTAAYNDSRDVFRHEYGHRIDHRIALRVSQNPDEVSILTRGLKNHENIGLTYVNKSGNRIIPGTYTSYDVQVSNLAARELLDDRIDLIDNAKAVVANKSYEDTFIAQRILRNRAQETGATYNAKPAIDEIFNTPNFPITKAETRKLFEYYGWNYSETGPSGYETFRYLNNIRFRVTKSAAKGGEPSFYSGGTLYDRHFNDFVGAVTDERSIGLGHGQYYYKDFSRVTTYRSDGFYSDIQRRGYGSVTNGHTTEAFANYTALTEIPNGIGEINKKLFTHYAPRTTAQFDRIYNNIRRLP